MQALVVLGMCFLTHESFFSLLTFIPGGYWPKANLLANLPRTQILLLARIPTRHRVVDTQTLWW